MRNILTVAAIVLSTTATAQRTYYFASSGNDANTGTLSSPYRTIAKANSLTTVSGDVLAFNGGETFTGELRINSNGVTVTSYGSGKATISGYTTVTPTLFSGSIYRAEIKADTALNLVTVNGRPVSVARYPNATYLTITAVGGSTSAGGTGTITGALPYQSKEIVIRKKRWNLERDTILTYEGGIIQYRQPYSGNRYLGEAGFGYFLQRDYRLIDTLNEWVYQNDTLYIRNATSAQVAVHDTIINIGSRSNVTVSNINVTGANEVGIYAVGGSNITITGVTVDGSGVHGIHLNQNGSSSVTSSTVKNCLGSGIYMRKTGAAPSTISVTNCTISNVALLGGMEISGDSEGRAGITAVGTEGITVTGNTIDSCGYLGIEFKGSFTLVKNNIVRYTNLVRDDGAGIYTYSGSGSTFTRYINQRVTGNIVTYAIGAPLGTPYSTSSARGIYLDEGTQNVLVDSNTIAYCGAAALYGNSDSGCVIRANNCYNNGYAWYLQRFNGAPLVRNMVLARNQFYPMRVEYRNLALSGSLESDFAALGRIDSNYYSAPTYTLVSTAAGGGSYQSLTRTFAQAQSLGLEQSAVSFAPTRLEINFTNSNKTVYLGGSYVDAFGTTYTNYITLAPYRSALLKAKTSKIRTSIVKVNSL